MLLAQAGYIGVGAWLAHIDIWEHRLPNRIVAPLAVGILALAIAHAATGSAAALARAGTGAILLGGFYFLLRAASGRALGGGDVKLAIPTGMVLAWDGWPALIAGGGLAFVLGGASATLLLATRRGTRSTEIPFGPYMVLGAVLGLAVT